MWLPDPTVVRRYQTPIANVTEIDPSAVFRGAKWENLDFSGSKLNGMRMFGCEIHNCRFNKCNLEGLRWWSMTITDTSFHGANLRRAALGGVQDGRRNVYRGVDFSEADMRETAYTAAAFGRCTFRHTKLVKIDFQMSSFKDCIFEGELNDVLFYCRGFKGESYPPNEMINIDFTRAKLRHVSFRGLTLDRVQLPNDGEHLVIKNFSSTLETAINALQKQGDMLSKKLIALLEIRRKWSVPNQAQGVLNRQDIIEVVGQEGLERLENLLRG
jgi:fluoroquinolone resistance protein